MNLNELWSGTDYAYYHYKGRGELYRTNATRVKVIRTFKEKIYPNERLSGFAEVMYVDKETGEPQTNSDGTHKTGQVRARDIAMRWEEYVELDDRHKAKLAQEERERRERRDRLEAERRRLEELERDKRDRIKRLLTEKYGLPTNYINDVNTYMVTLSRPELEREADAEYARWST